MSGMDVAVREIRFGRVWRVTAYRLVEDRDGVLALWTPPGNERLVPVDATGAEIRIPLDEPWVLGPRTTEQHALSLVTPGTRHSLTLHWTPEWRFLYWYVNLERWLGRGPRTIDYVDDKLDLVVTPAGSVRWKDEDELTVAAAEGLLDAAEVRAEAERVLAAPPMAVRLGGVAARPVVAGPDAAGRLGRRLDPEDQGSRSRRSATTVPGRASLRRTPRRASRGCGRS